MLDKNVYAGAIMMDHSKAFDTINHELLVTKRDVCGVKNNKKNYYAVYQTDLCRGQFFLMYI